MERYTKDACIIDVFLENTHKFKTWGQ